MSEENNKMYDSSDEALTHYGVKGMHWGVWNEETRAKYTGHSLRGETAKKMKKAVSERVEKAKTYKKNIGEKRQQKKAEKAEAREFDKKTRKQYHLSKKQYDRLRSTTLKSNDPTVVAKGMHLLNDQELNTKIDRLEREAKIRNLSTIKKTTEAKARKEAAEARSKKLPYQLGKAAGTMALKTVDNALVKPFANDLYKELSKKKNTVKAERVEEAAREVRTSRRNSESVRNNVSAQNPVYEAVVESVSDVNPNTSTASEYNRRGHLLLEEARKR